MASRSTELRLLIAAGGTGGHLFPALAVAQETHHRIPTAAISFVGGYHGLESRLIPQYGFSVQYLASGRLKGTAWPERLRTALRLPLVLRQAVALLEQFDPDVVLGAGGYASAPVVIAAAYRGLPVLLLEQNAIPGLTNRLLSRLATRVVTALPDTRGLLPPTRTLLLGNPLRSDLVAKLLDRAISRQPALPRRLLVLGGSQGARSVNQLILDALPLLNARLGQLIVHHQTGAADLERVRHAYRALGISAQTEPFIEDMASAYSAADLMIGRSGATTLAELAVAGLPALLIPYPHAADDHQTANAAAFVEAGAAVMFQQDTLSGARLADIAAELLENTDRLRRMARSMSQMARPHAAAAVVDILLELAH